MRVVDDGTVSGSRSANVEVLDSWLHYVESGSGSPVLLLHGNPTSSYMWRHVFKRVGDTDRPSRWIAPDLIGMGRSGKPAISYRLADHVAYLDGFVTALGLSNITLVGHDWGVALALDFFRRRPADVRAVAFMEGHVRPLTSWDEFDEGGRALFHQFRTPGLGEQMVLTDNFFIDTLLPAALIRRLSDSEFAVYRSPYPNPQSRQPLLQWSRNIPIDGHPPESAERMGAAAAHLSAHDVPKLLVHGDPGVLITAATVAAFRATLSNLTVVRIGGRTGHFLPEDAPDDVSRALIDWVAQLP